MSETHPLAERMRARHEAATQKGVACSWGCPVCKEEEGRKAISILSLQDWLDSDYAQVREHEEGKEQG